MISEWIPLGSKGTGVSVVRLIELAYNPRQVEAIRRKALAMTFGARSRDAKARKVYFWLKRNVAYVNDPRNVEFIQDPLWLLREAERQTPLAVGDCDDYAALVLALGVSLGIRCRIILTEDPEGTLFSNEHPFWGHIHVEWEVEKDKWRPVDPSMDWLVFGERVNGRRIAIDPESAPQEVLDGIAGPYAGGSSEGANRGGLGQGAFGIIGAGFDTIGGLVKFLVGTRAQSKAQKFQAKAQAAVAQAQGRYKEAIAELEHEAVQLEKERQARILEEAIAFERLEKTSKTVRMTPVKVGLAALGVVGLVALLRRRKR